MNFVYFLGRFHGLALHLPIGILLIVIVVEWLARKEKYRHLESSTRFLWGAAAVTAIGTVVLGFMHFSEGGFTGPSATAHRFLGTSIAVLSTLVFVLRSKAEPLYRKAQIPIAVLLLVLVTLTAQYGGNLTHGDTYFAEYAPRPIRRLAGLEDTRVKAGATPVAAAMETKLADPALLEQLDKAGYLARQVSQSDPHLIVNLAGAGATLSAEQVTSLAAAAGQVVSLSLQSAGLDDAAMVTVGKFSQLTFLRLGNNRLTDAGLKPLNGLAKLEYLNLYGNASITDASIDTLSVLATLKKVYLWGTKVSPRGAARLKELRPDLLIDLGDAGVPTAGT